MSVSFQRSSITDYEQEGCVEQCGLAALRKWKPHSVSIHTTTPQHFATRIHHSSPSSRDVWDPLWYCPVTIPPLQSMAERAKRRRSMDHSVVSSTNCPWDPQWTKTRCLVPSLPQENTRSSPCSRGFLALMGHAASLALLGWISRGPCSLSPTPSRNYENLQSISWPEWEMRLGNYEWSPAWEGAGRVSFLRSLESGAKAVRKTTPRSGDLGTTAGTSWRGVRNEVGVKKAEGETENSVWDSESWTGNFSSGNSTSLVSVTSVVPCLHRMTLFLISHLGWVCLTSCLTARGSSLPQYTRDKVVRGVFLKQKWLCFSSLQIFWWFPTIHETKGKLSLMGKFTCHLWLGHSTKIFGQTPV